MKYILLILLFIPYIVQGIEVKKLTCELAENPLVVTRKNPRFGWQISDEKNGTEQKAYAILLYSKHEGMMDTVWNSGPVMSKGSQYIAYNGLKELTLGKRYYWKVKVWDETGEDSKWSEENQFMTVPDTSFLNAHWIGAIRQEDAHLPEGRHFHSTVMKKTENKAAWAAVDTLSRKSIMLRKAFVADKKIEEAFAYVCGLGFYEFTLNGKKVGDSELTPLWSDYDKSVYYNVYDVTEMLKKGENAVGVLLGNGFYNVQGGRYRKLQISFGAPTLFFKMVLRYTDGTTEEIQSGTDWKYTLSPLTFNCIYGGEDYDARLEQKGWDCAGFDDSKWMSVVEQRAPKGVLRPQTAPPVKVMEYYKAKSINTIDSLGITVLDMGQNLSGFPEITLTGKRGDVVKIFGGESLESNGSVSQKRTGRSHYYLYTLKGGTETYRPRFSYYGYQYLQIEGAVMKGEKNPKKLPIVKDIRSCFVYNSAASVSTFETSNRIFNETHKIIDRAARSNMQAVFTDCPHREKLGWLEEVHLNGPGLLFNYDLKQFLCKVEQDVADAQHGNGMIPTIAPEYVEFGEPFGDSPEWGSTGIIMPFMYYEFYGDSTLITENYNVMRRYVDYLSSRAENHIISFGLGDWFDYGKNKPGFAQNTSIALVATSHYYMDLLYVVRAARMVGNVYDVNYYSQLARKVQAAFNARFYNSTTGQYDTGSQCANALPLFLNIPDSKEEYKRVKDNLVADIKAHGNRLSTGDVGNRYLFQTLARNGENELMYKMQNHEEVPGYGFQLKFGATTLTEQWDPRDGSSWNHFMMGQIEEWFFTSLAGIGQEKNSYGYKNIEIKPAVVGNLTHVKASHETIYGKLSVDWKREGGMFVIDVVIPYNCTAKIYVPGESVPREVRGGSYVFATRMK